MQPACSYFSVISNYIINVTLIPTDKCSYHSPSKMLLFTASGDKHHWKTQPGCIDETKRFLWRALQKLICLHDISCIYDSDNIEVKRVKRLWDSKYYDPIQIHYCETIKRHVKWERRKPPGIIRLARDINTTNECFKGVLD